MSGLPFTCCSTVFSPSFRNLTPVPFVASSASHFAFLPKRRSSPRLWQLACVARQVAESQSTLQCAECQTEWRRS